MEYLIVMLPLLGSIISGFFSKSIGTKQCQLLTSSFVSISGMILLVAMVGAITLTFTKRENIKRQNYFKQIGRDRDSSISLEDVESEKGVKIDD